MKIGVPKEIKNRENRVGLVPAGVRALVEAGHEVIVQQDAGLGSGIADAHFTAAGAKITQSPAEVWGAEMVVKVKEPLPTEFEFLRPNLILFTYLHLAAEKELTVQLMEKKVVSVAYETIQLPDRSLPLLTPMSEVAGRMSVQIGAYYLQTSWNPGSLGRGILLGGVPGVTPGKVVIIGGGVAGSNAAKMALGLGACVTIIDRDVKRLNYLEDVLSGRLTTLMSNHDTIYESVTQADLVIGTVLVAGARAPKLVTRQMISRMVANSVVVDVSVDQGGCVETCRPTSHEEPTYVVDDVIHYCVTNMPGAVSRTSTFSLTNVTLPYALMLANEGVEQASMNHEPLKLGINTYQGALVHDQISLAHGIEYTPLKL